MEIKENGCSLRLYIDIEERSIYLAGFYSIHKGMGNFTQFLTKQIAILKENYPHYLIYADCNKMGTGVAIKAGGRITDILNRITF